MPGIGEVIDGAMQQAPQWGRQSMSCYLPQKARNAQDKTLGLFLAA